MTSALNEPSLTSSKGKLAVITCHFNWCGYQQHRKNLREFIQRMDAANIPVYGVEAALPDHEFITLGIEGWRQIRVNNHSILFQKEALLNMASKLPPASFTKLAWLDADLSFSNSDWFLETERLLDVCPVVQPFSMAVWNYKDGVEIERKISAASLMTSDPKRSHTGFAFAARRSLWENGPALFDAAVVGAGDVLFCHGLYNDGFTGHRLAAVGESKDEYSKWVSDFRAWYAVNGGGSALAVPGMCIHSWHGDISNRGYTSRYEAIAGFDATKHIVKTAEGFYTWTSDAPVRIMAAVEQHFITRKEDG